MAKYRKGDKALSIGQVAEAIMADKCLYFNDKVQNAGWLQNMNLRTLNRYVMTGHVWYAVEKEPADG